MKNQTTRVIVLGILVILLGGAIWYLSDGGEQLMISPQETQAPVTTTTPSGTGTIKVALLDYTGEKPGKSRGCDHVVLVDRAVATTSATLNAALTELFAINETEIAGLGNFMPKTKATLHYDHVTLANGLAKVYLTGSLSGLAGVCDDPRAKIQIEETALQFPTVQSVELYLNGVKTALQPDEKGA